MFSKEGKMKKVGTENEHHRNLANFDVLIAKLINLGKQYKPIRTAIHLSALQLVSQNAKNALINVHDLEQRYQLIFMEREYFFDRQQELMSQIKTYILSFTAMTELELYLVSGCRHMPLVHLEKNLRHDFLLQNWSKLIHLIKTLVHYKPSQAELEIEGLQNFYMAWYEKHKELKQVEAYLNQAYTIREEVFYRNRYGLVAIAGIVRNYIKFHFGWNSGIYKQVIALPIKRSKWEYEERSKVAEFL